MMKRYLLLLAVIAVSASCSFNSKFLQPGVIPPETRELSLGSEREPTVMRFEGDARQPELYRNGGEKMDLPYTIESVVFQSASGNLLNGWMLKPIQGRVSITLLHMHGNGGNVVSQAPGMTPFINYGMQVFVFDYSGFGFSGGDATRKNVLLDAESALDYVKDRQDVKGTKLVVYGQSLGGNVAAVVASENNEKVDALVLEGAFSSHKDMAAGNAGFIGRMLVSEQYSARKSISGFRKPLLVIHSNEDRTVPFEQGQKIYEAANQPKEFMEIEQCHICGPRFYGQQIAEKIREMAEK